ncbi:MAG: NACHT domain protein [Potamolinea sp.]
MIDPVTVINAIIGTARSMAIAQLVKQAKREETVIKILTKLGLEEKHPNPDFETVYAYALVKYGVDKVSENGVETTEAILQLFREEEIKEAFEKSFYTNDDSILAEAVKKQTIWESSDWNTLGDTLLKLNVDFRKVLADFSAVFIDVVKLSQNPGERMSEQKIDGLGGKLDKVIDILSKRSDVVNTPYPQAFQALIQRKIEKFCGRKFVFQRFAQFLENHPKGYFTVLGDAGMGKSAIAAKYVYDNHPICYFNVLVERNNTPEMFLESIRGQLINRYRLENAEKACLADLLAKVAQKLGDGERLVLVVDALDEVEQVTGPENILYLPKTLPDGVYFLLTRRPYEPGKKRLYTEGVSMEELDLKKTENQQLSREDVKEYIHLFLNHDREYQDALHKWIGERNYTTDYFVEQVADKSQNNFMYLSYVLPAIAKGDYQDLGLKDLPEGLQQYYQNHWVRMKMETQRQEIMVIVLFIFVSIGTPISCEMIAGMAGKDEYDVKVVLDEWTEYLNPQEIEGDSCYTIYHASFRDFLKEKAALSGKRKLFKEVNIQIAEYWEKWESETGEND